MAQIKDETQPANARTLGTAVRKTLKALGLDWKVKCQTVSFSGFGYGAAPFAEIDTERRLTGTEKKSLAACLRELRARSAEEGGGTGIIRMSGNDYAFGGTIGYKDHPEDSPERDATPLT